MAYQKEKQYIFQLLKAILDGSDIRCEITGLDWNYIYKLCKYHKIDNIIAYKVCSEPFSSIIPEDFVEKFRLSLQKAKAREAVQHIEYEQIIQLFEENKIKNIPLKGSVLKYYYPSPDMRFMMDLDILCQEQDMEKVGILLKKMGFDLKHPGNHHDVYIKPPYLVIEVHKVCYAENEKLDEYFSTIWDRSQKREGKDFTYDMTWDDFYIFLIGHMAKHFIYSGIGVRSLLDLIVFKQKLEKNCNRSYIEKILKNADLLKLEKKMNALAERCFYRGLESSQSDNDLMDFIWESGIKGTWKNRMGFQIIEQGGKKQKILQSQAKILTRCIFLDKNHMQEMYPYVKKCPFLLPIAWIHRGVKKLIFEPQRIFKTIQRIFDRKNVARTSKAQKDAGL